MGLCSQQCPCNINNSTSLDNFRRFYPQIANTWTINNNVGATNFPGCSSQIQQNAYDTAQLNHKKQFPTSDVNTSFELSSFYRSFAAIENTFNCTGFCQTNYINSNNQNTTIIKFLFTNINRY